MSVKGSTNSLSAVETADELSEVESVAFEEADVRSSQHPLFLHLMCSIRDRSLAGSEIGLIHLNTLPTCLGKHLRRFLTTAGRLLQLQLLYTVTDEILGLRHSACNCRNCCLP